MIGLCPITLRLPENHSLKDKRMVVRPVPDRSRNKFNVSIAEVMGNDVWQILTLGVSTVSTDIGHANRILSHVMNHIQSAKESTEFVDCELEFTSVL